MGISFRIKDLGTGLDQALESRCRDWSDKHPDRIQRPDVMAHGAAFRIHERAEVDRIFHGGQEMKRQKTAWILVLALLVLIPAARAQSDTQPTQTGSRPAHRQTQMLKISEHTSSYCAPMSGSKKPRSWDPSCS